LVVKNGSKMCSCSSAGMPGPSSLTRSQMQRVPVSFAALATTRPPSSTTSHPTVMTP
jgi:hypothetical protein